jgi:hypothetical protein
LILPLVYGVVYTVSNNMVFSLNCPKFILSNQFKIVDIFVVKAILV